LSLLNTEGGRTDTTGNTTNTGKHAISAGTEFVYDSNHIVFQENGVAPPPAKVPAFETGRDAPIYSNEFADRSDRIGWMHVDEFTVLGQPYMNPGGNKLVNLKFIAAQNRVDFRLGYSANRRLGA
jgi:hypothetical protein